MIVTSQLVNDVNIVWMPIQMQGVRYSIDVYISRTFQYEQLIGAWNNNNNEYYPRGFSRKLGGYTSKFVNLPQ